MSAAEPVPGDGEPTLKISELAEAAGVPVATVRHYLREGLLPEGRKTSRNMAYYPAATVDRIHLIKLLQEERFMPLRVIRELLDREGGDTEAVRSLLAESDREIDRALAPERERTPAAAVSERYDVPAAVLERFGSKEGSRRLLASHGLPTIPGSDGLLRDDMHALAEADRIGYPVLIKPSAGGGGKGMRMVRTPRELESALRVCRSEAKAAFGDDSLYLEKWLDENRHVEVQVAVDRYGHGIHLGERDCSVQRRHQKILEEEPTPALSDAARAELADRAIRAVVAAGYENVGTLEFLVDANGDFYFIEINCRIQVEHPVTEMLTGVDMVATQMRIAAGEPLGISQSDIALRGHAIEFRINAEDPDHEFRPSAGVVERYLAPGGLGVRMDSHLYTGYEVPPYYDSLLGKLIVWGPDRPSAIARGRAALDGLVIEGLETNISIHQALLASETFLDGKMTTNLLDRVGSAAFLAAAARV